jgi:uncharacterized protein
MVMTYRRPGVYLEESLLINPSDVAGTITVGALIGVAEKGPINEPVLVESWSDYTTYFGGFSLIQPPTPAPLPDPNNVSGAAFGAQTFPDLTTLKADPTLGDTHYPGPAFTAGQYAIVGTNTQVHCTGVNAAAVWTAGPVAGTGQPLPPAPAVPPQVLSYLPYSVYSFFQNGGRFAWIVRSTPTAVGKAGTVATIPVNGADTVPANKTSFVLNARSVGLWGNSLKYGLVTQDTKDTGTSGSPHLEDVFSIQVLLRNPDGLYEVVETFTGLSVSGLLPGTRGVGAALNDPYAGSRYLTVASINSGQPQPGQTDDPVSLDGGTDPAIPDGPALISSAQKIAKVEGPINVNICGYLNDASKVDTSEAADAWISTTVPSSAFPDRQDIMVINDSAPPRVPGQDSANYSTMVTSTLGQFLGDSYCASYGPWVVIPNPQRIGSTITIPPGGAVMGMMARIDSTIGVFRAPAGIIAGLANAVGVQTKFTDTELGDLNSRNINIIRSVVGAGICVMGGRTRKTYGADRYVSARRTLIQIKEQLRRSTQWAVFENNDERLWSGLRLTADRILRPMWEAGGLAGTSAAEAYFIRCDRTLNTPSVVQSGEVRMEIGVALEYPAEFVIIRITQFDRGSISAEVQPTI